MPALCLRFHLTSRNTIVCNSSVDCAGQLRGRGSHFCFVFRVQTILHLLLGEVQYSIDQSYI